MNALAREVSVDGIDYQPGEAFVVALNQPQYTMIRSLFDRVTAFEENIFYDVSGWTLPLAYDLDYAALGNRYNAGLLGDVVTPQPIGLDAPDMSSYGYVLRWSDYYAPRALYRLLDADLRVRVATEPVEISTSEGNVAFGPGAVFVPLVGQDADRDTIHALVSEAATEDGVAVWSVTSGSTADGTPDIGDGSFRAVQRPEVLVLFDDGLALYDAGEVWHQLDHRMHIPVTLRRKDEIGGLDWSRYTHLIIVGGRNTSLSDSAQTRIAQWVREEGGTIIATRQAAAMAQETFLGLELPEDEASEEPLARRNYADMPVSEAEHVIGGALFAGDMDPSHPIGFGYQDRSITLHRNTTLRLARPDSDPFAVVAVSYTHLTLPTKA